MLSYVAQMGVCRSLHAIGREYLCHSYITMGTMCKAAKKQVLSTFVCMLYATPMQRVQLKAGCNPKRQTLKPLENQRRMSANENRNCW